ncbi:MAG: hypothetical protein DSY80_04485, partial [Desulfocapsa sp.]
TLFFSFTTGGYNNDCPAQTPTKNIHRKIQKHTTAIPAIPLLVSWNFTFLTGFFRFLAAINGD